jgi:hypothetical protein
LAHRGDVGAVVDAVWGELVRPSVARKERDAPALDDPDGHRRRGRSVRRVELDFVDVVEKRVEPRAPEYSDVGAVSVQAVFASLLELDESDLGDELSELELPESDVVEELSELELDDSDFSDFVDDSESFFAVLFDDEPWSLR